MIKCAHSMRPRLNLSVLIWLCLASWLVVPQLNAGGVIEGVVALPPPKPSAAPVSRYGEASAAVAQPKASIAAVYLEGQFSYVADTNMVYEMWQKNFQFNPGLLVVPKGARIAFPNADEEYHNVFSYSKTKEFDLGRYRKDEKPPILVFDKPGAVELNCEIHQHMRGTILVVDTPYLTTTGEGGKFRLENLPEGKFTLKAWLGAKKILSQPVEVKDGAVVTANFPAN